MYVHRIHLQRSYPPDCSQRTRLHTAIRVVGLSETTAIATCSTISPIPVISAQVCRADATRPSAKRGLQYGRVRYVKTTTKEYHHAESLPA